MAHGVRLRRGKAEWCRNRFVVDDTTAGSLLRLRLPLTGPRNGRYENTVNTNIVDIAGRTYATVEAG
jgi:carotenoid cleavage dioxygenase-like enzyme